MPTIKGLTGEWIDVFMCISLHPGTSVLQEYWVMPLVHLHLMTCTVCIFLFYLLRGCVSPELSFRVLCIRVYLLTEERFSVKFWTDLNKFEQLLNKFGPIWTHLNTFEQVLNKFEHIWTSLNTFEHIWTLLNTFKHIWTSLNTIEQVLNKIEQNWIHLNSF